MTDPPSTPLSNMPPWGWVLVYLAGGSAIGVGGFGLTQGQPSQDVVEECPDPGFQLFQAQQEIEDLKKAHESMVVSLNMITGLLSGCNSE